MSLSVVVVVEEVVDTSGDELGPFNSQFPPAEKDMAKSITTMFAKGHCHWAARLSFESWRPDGLCLDL